MMRIPLQAVPAQTLAVTVAKQAAQIKLRQLGDGLYFDLESSGASIVRTRVVRDRVRILTDALYRGFRGDFVIVDTQGTSDPVYTGLGSRFVLYYIGADE